MTDRSKRKLLAILAADVVGYSKHVVRDEEGTVNALRKLIAAVRPIIADFDGRVVDTAGDGVLAEFPSAVRATEAAIAIQQRAQGIGVEAASKDRLQLRIGVNVGDVMIENDGIFGDGVNVAARLEQLAPPGGILISGTAYDQLRGKLDLPIDFAGDQAVKNIPLPVRTYSVRMNGAKRTLRLRARGVRRHLFPVLGLVALALAGGAAWWLQSDEIGPSAKPSVAVLPFTDIGGDETSGRLAAGLTEDIITDLARFPEFDVVARNSTEAYKGKPVDAREVASALHVGFVLEGSIQRQAGRVRITAQLIEAKTGRHLWSENWDRPAEDVFAVQTEIAEQVTNRLGGGAGLIQEAGRVSAKRKAPKNLSAYDYYLLGTEKIEQFTKADVEEAVRLLNRAVELDPGLARAWVELYHSHSLLANFGVNPEIERKAADEAAERAVLLDPRDAEAHAVLGMSFGVRGDMTRAKAEFDTALRLAPGSAEILTFYVGWAPTFGEPERGAQMVDQAIRLNPSYPMWASNLFAYGYFMVGRHDDALKMLERLPPDSYQMGTWAMRSGALASLGRTADAKKSVEEALRRHPKLTIEAMANEPGYSEAERQLFIKTMRLAGFPACAQPEELARMGNPVRLPECTKS